MAQSLVYADEEEDDDEDLLDDQQVAAFCPSCGDEIRLTEEVFHIAFARAYQTANGVEIQELKPDGQPVGTPCIYCFECWENHEENLRDNCEDVLPIQDVYDHGLLECDICQSDICEGETFAIETFGEVRWSKRCPNGTATMAFEHLSQSVHICIDCISNVEEDDEFQLEVYDYDGQDTCAVGRHLRCWRDRSRCIHCPNNKK